MAYMLNQQHLVLRWHYTEMKRNLERFKRVREEIEVGKRVQ